MRLLKYNYFTLQLVLFTRPVRRKFGIVLVEAMASGFSDGAGK